MSPVHVAALVQLGLGGGIDGRAEGVDPVKALALQRAGIFAEQGQHQGLLGLEHLQPAQKDPAQAKPGNENYHDGHEQRTQPAAEEPHAHYAQRGDDVTQEHGQQHQHAVLFIIENFLVHSFPSTN